MHPDRYFTNDPQQLPITRQLYQSVAHLPLVCPHGHVDPGLFTDPNYRFGNPVELLIQPDHYLLRMLHAAGTPFERLLTTKNPRQVWQHFAENFHLFRGTPSGIWLREELEQVFGIEDKLNPENAERIYDRISEKLTSKGFRPRELYARFNIEVLCTTDAATDILESHQTIRASTWNGRILPTFRPDSVVNLDTPGWLQIIDQLRQVTSTEIHNFSSFIQALQERRDFFKSMGATAADHSALSACTQPLSTNEAERTFQRALRAESSPGDAARFTAHMLMEMARMSADDGLVMQLHTGSYRNHDLQTFQKYGPDKGADIPVQAEFTHNLAPLLNRFGCHPNLTLIVFTLDEGAYSRDLAPLAGFYPAMKLGPPWWFHDSLNGMRRYFDRVIETTGLYNTVGFNDDTRAFLSIPVRHDLWRRVACDWLASLLIRHIIDEEDAYQMARALAYDLAKSAYRL
jgi:glucuronate isomerase